MRRIVLFAAALLICAAISLSSVAESMMVSIQMNTLPDDLLYNGEVELQCVVGFDVPVLEYRWQYSEDGDEWFDVGCESDTYTFTLDETNASYYYRVSVLVEYAPATPATQTDMVTSNGIRFLAMY